MSQKAGNKESVNGIHDASHLSQWTVPSLVHTIAHVVEQITVRIFQIMIQATDLAQILYMGQPSRKKRGPRKISIWPPFFKMAAMGYPEILFFALNGQQMVEKDNYENRFYVLSIANVQIVSWTLIKCSDPFNMAANIQDGRHRLSCNVIVP